MAIFRKTAPTGLNLLENMGIRMIDNFVGGYLNFLVVFICLLVFSPVTALIALAGAACYMGYTGVMELSVMLMFVFFSFGIFASLEPISDSAHVLAVINAAMDQLDALKEGNFIDSDGKNVSISHYDIEFSHLQSDRTFL